MVVVEPPSSQHITPHLTLVSGAARCGKSRWAEQLAHDSRAAVVVVVTGPAEHSDPHWQQRVAEHRRRRPQEWQTWEVEEDLAAALGRLGTGQLGLVDSIGTWVAAHLEADASRWRELCGCLIGACQDSRAPLILVCEETGWGVVPPTAIGGLFRDRLGLLQQQLCAVADRAWLVTAGRALDLHALSLPVP